MESEIKELILRRKTSKPANFTEEIPDPALIRDLIEIGRHAPNHHRTNPPASLTRPKASKKWADYSEKGL